MSCTESQTVRAWQQCQCGQNCEEGCQEIQEDDAPERDEAAAEAGAGGGHNLQQNNVVLW